MNHTTDVDNSKSKLHNSANTLDTDENMDYDSVFELADISAKSEVSNEYETLLKSINKKCQSSVWYRDIDLHEQV